MTQNDQNPFALKQERKAVLRALKPVVELTPRVRPLLLIATRLPADESTVLFGILFHQEKAAFQSRLRFRYSPGHQEILRATTWTPFPDRQAFEQHKGRVIQAFDTMAVTLGGKAAKLEFAPGASDEAVLQALRSSGILEILR
jgi:hypothetical protein